VSQSGQGLDRVELRGLRARGRHGVLPHETALGQTFVVDLTLHLDTRPAAESDDLERTVDYGAMAVAVVAVVAGEPVALIETLAQRVADVALGPERVRAVDVSIHKPEAPITVPFDDVVVTIHRERG
jgi:7,8-dihydroneopterin aldolase/epimerase/oxygenase